MTTASSSAPLDITVVIPTHNRAHLVSRALDSVRSQTRAPNSVIVVDDASDDNTIEVVQKWVSYNRFAVRIEKLPRNGGPAAARNRGITLADTRYVAFLDSDDEYYPNALETLIYGATQCQDAALSFADATVVSDGIEIPHGLFQSNAPLNECMFSREGESQIFRLTDAKSILLKASVIPTSATCFLRNAALRCGGMPEAFRTGEDWLFWLRLTNEGPFVFQFCDVVRHYRHGENLTGSDAAERIAREKLRGYLALERGMIGVSLSEEQKGALQGHIRKQVQTWRYHLSRFGLREYSRGIRSDVGRTAASPFGHVVNDPRSVLRALYWSMRTSRGDDTARPSDP